MKKNILLVLLTSFLLILSFKTYAFWIIKSTTPTGLISHSDGIHQQITENSASKYKYKPFSAQYRKFCPEGGCTFSGKSVSTLKKYNTLIDGGNYKEARNATTVTGSQLKTRDIPAYHCDNESINACSDIVENGRKKVADLIVEAITFFKAMESTSDDASRGMAQSSIQNAQIILGGITHTLQDFYSHSNWIEMNYEGAFDVTKYSYNGEDPEPNLTDEEIKILVHPSFGTASYEGYTKDPEVTTCITTESTTALNTSKLTTGYYEKTPDIYGIGLSGVFFNTKINGNKINDYWWSGDLNHNGPYYVGFYEKIESCSVLTNTCPPEILSDKGNLLIHKNSIFYYHPTPTTNTKEKCQHGDSLNNSTVLNRHDHFGIAKDSPERRYHQVAKETAIVATTQLIESIISDIYNRYYDDTTPFDRDVDAAVLSFLGYKKGEINVKVSDSGEYYYLDNGYFLSLINTNGEIVKSVSADSTKTYHFDINILDYPINVILSKEFHNGYKEIPLNCSFRISPNITLSSFYQYCEIDREDLSHDLIAPSIVVNGQSNIIHTKGEVYIDLGAVATDDVDGSIQVNSSGIVNINQIGTYIITYTATDRAGNTATANRMINVVETAPDTKAPTITLYGESNITIIKGGTYTEEFAKVIDDIDGLISINLSPIGSVDVDVIGTYILSYTAKDKSNNTATKHRTINVVNPKVTIEVIEAPNTNVQIVDYFTVDIKDANNNNIVSAKTVYPRESGAEFELSPGKYTIKISRDGYKTTEKQCEVPIEATFVCSIVMDASGNVIFRDDFDVLDKNFWFVQRARSPNVPDYSAVSVSDGILTLSQDQTDNGPSVISKPIKIGNNSILTIKRRSYVHPQVSYSYQGGDIFFSGSLGLYASNDIFNGEVNDYITGVSYFDYEYQGDWETFVLHNDRNKTENYITPKWNEWFEEELTYDSNSGKITYKINGDIVSETIQAIDTEYVKIHMHTYGWWTGHYTKLDYIDISVAETSTVDNTDISNGLVAYYPFNGDAKNHQGSANDGQPSSSVSFGDGLFGQAAIFGGVDNPGHIYVPNSAALQFTEGATYSAWFRVDDLIYMDGYGRRQTTGGGGTIFAKSHDRIGAAFKSHVSNNGVVSASVSTFDRWFSNGSYAEANWPEEKSIGEWIHLTYTLSATAGTKIYLDGKLSYGSTSPVDFTQMNRQSLYFGKFSDSWYPFIGAIDEVRIHKRVLNEAEIQQLYNTGLIALSLFP